jgi:hypothetical protein
VQLLRSIDRRLRARISPVGQPRRIDCVRGESASPSIAATSERFARKSLDATFGGPIHASSALHLCVPPQSGQRERTARGRLESNTHSAFRPVETGSRVRGHLIRISGTLDLPCDVAISRLHAGNARADNFCLNLEVRVGGFARTPNRFKYRDRSQVKTAPLCITCWLFSAI